ncbi:Protein lev-9 [Collichthys lucidus]|uniref:Beta-2-glycoprotein 1 n=1 Tax=Collichthys lucidus TaxID=240159 RepID=A0A4U5V337_COLLU|nr:Protein lev-9 [Collichthys lucidus]
MDRALLLLSLWALTGTVSLQASGSCPERLVGEERRRTCPRPCKADKDCGNKRQCLCDGQCGLSCVAPVWARNVAYVELVPGLYPPVKTQWLASSLPLTPFLPCLKCAASQGFTLPNGLDVTIRRCQGDRQWSGDEPNCTEAESPKPPAVQTCPLPEEVTNTFSIQGDAAVGTSIRYSCLSGADIVGSSENFCQDNQTWQYPHPICKSKCAASCTVCVCVCVSLCSHASLKVSSSRRWNKAVYCQPPREVEHGYVVAVQKIEYETGFDIHYLCKKNFLLDGPQKVTCLSNGSWSATPPYCRARCLIPAERSRVMINGVKRWPFDVTDAMVPHGENVAFYCKHPHKQCSFTAPQTCFDGKLQPPACYLEPTWLQYKLFPHRLVSEIEACKPSDDLEV